ncbi:MAG: DUF167 family protein [Halothiobacillus sp.]|nr:DUF167 family protein [Halothiobacillus sp.]
MQTCLNLDTKNMNKQRVRVAKAKSEGPGLDIPSFCAWDGDDLVLNILGSPGSTRDAIGKSKGKQLKISVTAAAVAGKATDHMVRFLAGEFGVPVTHITVVFGRYNVNKQLRIKDPARLPSIVAKALAVE